MRLVFAAGIITTVLSGCSVDVPALGTPQPATDLEPDPTFHAKEGDREQLFGFMNGSVMESHPPFQRHYRAR